MTSIDVGRVGMIPLSSVLIGERARKEMGDLASLETSIKDTGLIAPLCVKETDTEGKYFLLGGERRFGVLMKNGVMEVPVRIYPSDISPLQIKAIELAENFYRKDFEWYEYDNLVRDMHKLQQEIHGEKISTAADATGWGMKDTASLMNISKSSVSDAVKRAEAREAFPELFNGCKTQRDASKVLVKLQETAIKEVLAKKVEANKTSSTVSALVKGYILQDFFHGVKAVPDRSIHLVEIDPPYAIDLKEQKKKDGESIYNLNDYNEVDKGTYPEFMLSVFQQCYRVMADHSWLVCWFAPEPWFDAIYQLLVAAGFGTTRMCGIWTKGTPGQSMNPSMRLANSYEMFFYAWKGQPALNKAGHGNDFHHSPVPPNQKVHPTERPIELMKEIYDTFAFTGSRVMIPFLGSGVGLIAAHQLGLSAFGYELGKSHRDSYLVRVSKMQ